MTKTKSILLRSTAATLIAGGMLQASLAMAQAPAAQPAAAPTVVPEEDAGPAIIVTGSRIPQPNLTAAAPVTVVGAEEIKLQGTTRIEDLLNSLPQVSAGQTGGESNDATGAASVDLRGLGVNRTLVLINGRRLMPGDPTDSSADLNAIPNSLIKRVEVLTGGASTTYGADAVAGVVNFIMDTNFTGVRLDGQYSFFQHNNRNKITPPLLDARAATLPGYDYPKGSVSDGSQYDASIAFGTGFADNKGHVVGYLGYREVKPVLQRNRDYSACNLQDVSATAQQCGGSSTSPEGNALLFTGGGGSSTFYNIGPNRTLVPGRTRYNYAPLNYFQRPDKRYTAGFFANYEVNDAIKPYAEFMFMDDRTLAQIAPSGDFGNTFTINCDNPLMSAQQRTIICANENLINGFIGTYPLARGASFSPNQAAPAIGFVDSTSGAVYNKAYFNLLRRNVEGGPRIADLQHTQFRGVLGTKGELSPAWSYDISYQYSRTNYSQIYSNEFSVARLNRALDVVAGPGGTPICRSVRDGSDPNCVPYDIFSRTGATQGAIDYLSATGFQKAVLTEKILGGSITGQLGEYGIQFPSANDGVTINIGGEYRREGLNLQTDNAFSTGDLTGQGAPTKPIKGSFNVKEFFGEIQVPIIQKGFIDNLSLNGAYRYSKYKLSNGNSFSTDTFKIGIELAPIRELRFRAGYNRAVRAPNLQELFAPVIVALDGSTDPCAGITLTAANAGCLAQGLNIGQTVTGNPAGQYNGQIGGTETLRPEKATTKTIGFVFQPSFVPRLAITVDYYDIKVKDAIQDFGTDAIVTYCSATADPFACSLVHRNPAGSLWLSSDGYVQNLKKNIGGVKTRGVDIGVSYSHPLGSNTLGLAFQGTYLDKLFVDNGLSEPYDCAGYYGATCSQGADGVPSGPNARWRHKARVSFAMKNGFGLSLQWRYFGGVKVDFLNPSSTTSGPSDPFSQKIKAQNYLDLTGSFKLNDTLKFRLGVNNILDRQPPLITSGRADGTRNQCPTGPCSGNTYSGVYDALGRYIFAGVSVDF